MSHTWKLRNRGNYVGVSTPQPRRLKLRDEYCRRQAFAASINGDPYYDAGELSNCYVAEGLSAFTGSTTREARFYANQLFSDAFAIHCDIAEDQLLPRNGNGIDHEPIDYR